MSKLFNGTATVTYPVTPRFKNKEFLREVYEKVKKLSGKRFVIKAKEVKGKDVIAYLDDQPDPEKLKRFNYINRLEWLKETELNLGIKGI